MCTKEREYQIFVSIFFILFYRSKEKKRRKFSTCDAARDLIHDKNLHVLKKNSNCGIPWPNNNWGFVCEGVALPSDSSKVLFSGRRPVKFFGDYSQLLSLVQLTQVVASALWDGERVCVYRSTEADRVRCGFIEKSTRQVRR